MNSVTSVAGAEALVHQLLSSGQFVITTAQAATALGIPADHVRVRFANLVRKRRLFAPAKGLWMAVPPHYGEWGAPPALEFIDPLMNFLERDYYVGWLSAAELHGAAHHRPQVLQVAVNKRTLDRHFGRSTVNFTQRVQVVDLPRVQRNVPTGRVWIASVELTILDVVDDSAMAGGVGNAATVVSELFAEHHVDVDALVDVASRCGLPTQRRLGFALDRVGATEYAERIHVLTESRRHFPIDRLSLTVSQGGVIDERWRLLVNDVVEIES